MSKPEAVAGNNADDDALAPVVTRVGQERQRLGVCVLGGPTTVIDVGGRRFVTDPTFDQPGNYGYHTKTAGPAVPASALGPVDAVLISHDEHFDNLDPEGRRFALSAPMIVTHPGAAQRLGPSAKGLEPWATVEFGPCDGGGAVIVQAVPAVHGPADGDQDGAGNVTSEVTGFVLMGDDIPTIYVSGDNASLGAVAAVAERCGPIDVAVLFAGAARLPSRQNGRPLTLTAARAAAAAEVLDVKVVIPAHVDGWALLTEGVDDVAAAFDDAGISHMLKTAPAGQWITLD